MQQIISRKYKMQKSSQNIYTNQTENQAENMSAKPLIQKAILPQMLSG